MTTAIRTTQTVFHSTDGQPFSMTEAKAQRLVNDCLDVISPTFSYTIRTAALAGLLIAHDSETGKLVIQDEETDLLLLVAALRPDGSIGVLSWQQGPRPWRHALFHAING